MKIKRKQRMELLRQALSMCLDSNMLGSKELCLLLCTCKGIRDAFTHSYWDGYPHAVELSLAQPTAVAWIAQHGHQLQHICFTEAYDTLLENILTNMQRRGPHLTVLQVHSNSLLRLSAIPSSVQQLDVSGCSKLAIITAALPSSLRTFRCLGCPELPQCSWLPAEAFTGVELGLLQHEWLELDYLQQLTRLELDGLYDIKQLGHNLPDSVQQITYRRVISIPCLFCWVRLARLGRRLHKSAQGSFATKSRTCSIHASAALHQC
jgi:hypothetical protein